ncbi:MAG TPA: hypothetical protein VJ276_15790 [Thermoanaerobaculia bacterium]|nr:hypothetical protein [Thermoanaerobaculia bacterium]
MFPELTEWWPRLQQRRGRFLLVVAGPARADFAEACLRSLPFRVVDPQIIARVLAASDEEAVRLAEETREELVSRGEPFCVVLELTDSELDYLRQVRAHDYAILLVFLGSSRPELPFPNLFHLLRFTEHAFLFDDGCFVAELRGHVIRHGKCRPRWWTKVRR